MRRHSKYQSLNLCLGAIVVLLLLTLLCPGLDKAEATEVGDTGRSVMRSGANITIAVPASIDLELLPTGNDSIASSTVPVRISASGTGGYELYLTSQDDTMLHNKHHSATIASITEPTTLAQFSTNTWGYTVSEQAVSNSTVFAPVSTDTKEAIVSTTNATANDSYNLAIGAKVDTALPAGAYYNTLMITVVAKPVDVFSGITYLQDMTPEICSMAEENDTMQLIDKRDGKSYWVAKLKDGNCWMTQNLALDITEDGLSATDTDIEEDWNQSSTIKPLATTSDHNSFSQDNETPFSYNFGEYVYATPDMLKSCNSIAYYGMPISDCKVVGFTDVSDTIWKPTFTAQEGDFTGALSDGTYHGYVAANEQDHTYDPHYLIGNYYSFVAATAGTGGNMHNANASGSICPKNWQLPKSSAQAGANNNTFGRLFQKYGLVSGSNTTGASKNNKYNIFRAPFFLVATGYYAMFNSLYPHSAGAAVYLHTAYRQLYGNVTHTLIANATTLYPVSSDNRTFFTMPIRCLVTAPTN